MSEQSAVPGPAAATSPILQVSGLAAGYHGIAVVRDIAITVAPGEIVAMLGSNGAGKTTTLSAIAGLIRPLSGSIRFGGSEVGGMPAYKLSRTGLALVPESRSLFSGMTTRENLRVARGRRRATDDEVLDLLPELRKCLGRKAGLLSGGEQQMLAIGRALVGRPKLLIVDEMSLGLAPVVVARLLPVLRSAADRLGAAVLVVEQHVSLALELAERAYVLAHGRIVLRGRTSDLRSNRELLMACYLGDVGAADRFSAEVVDDGAA